MANEKVVSEYPKRLEAVGCAHDTAMTAVANIKKMLLEHNNEQGVEVIPSHVDDLAHKMYIYGSIQLLLDRSEKEINSKQGTKK